MTTRWVVPGLWLGLAGCSGGADRAAPVRATVTPITVPLGEFHHLQYLSGSWKGTRASDPPFFERYAFLNDSTLQSVSYRQDSTFTAPAETSLVVWTGGQVRSGGPGASWLATAWGPDSVRFDPEKGVTNSFTWVRHSPDSWTARLDLPGKPSDPVVYAMRRVGP